jgi:benzoyl-CoA reductase/2-hydroxyglutaryl-CoA dehydratase subunit BcrC/BadD/HgdB
MSEDAKKGIRLKIANDSKQAHSYSAAIGRLFDMAINYVPDVEAAHQSGQNAVWYEGGSWYTLIYACDVIPALLTLLFSFTGDKGVAVAREKFQIPMETCVMAQSAIGEYYLRKDSTIKRILYSSGICEPLSQGFEFIKKFDYDTFVIDGGFIPADGDSERFASYKSFYREECNRMIDWLIGKPIDKDKLRFEHKRFNRIQKKVRTIINLRKHHTTYLKNVPMILILSGNGHYYGKPDAYEEMLDDIIEEMSALEPDAYNEAKVKFAWVGQRGSVNVMDAIDEAGGAITVWYVPGYFDKDFRVDIDPLEAAIEYTVGDEYYGGTTEDKCRKIEEFIGRDGVKGMFLYTLMGCSFGTIEQELERVYFQKRDIATLAISGIFEEGKTTGQLETRIKAFVEMLS